MTKGVTVSVIIRAADNSPDMEMTRISLAYKHPNVECCKRDRCLMWQQKCTVVLKPYISGCRLMGQQVRTSFSNAGPQMSVEHHCLGHMRKKPFWKTEHCACYWFIIVDLPSRNREFQCHFNSIVVFTFLNVCVCVCVHDAGCWMTSTPPATVTSTVLTASCLHETTSSEHQRRTRQPQTCLLSLQISP